MEKHLIDYPINEGKNGIFKASGLEWQSMT